MHPRSLRSGLACPPRRFLQRFQKPRLLRGDRRIGFRHKLAGDFHQWIYYDLLYVQHMSALVDLKIVLATIATLGGKWSVPLTWIIPSRTLQEAWE